MTRVSYGQSEESTHTGVGAASAASSGSPSNRLHAVPWSGKPGTWDLEGLLGLEEYVSDAVILLDHRVHDQASTRRLRVVKYRGSHHGTNEYPLLIGTDGIGSSGLTREVPSRR